MTSTVMVIAKAPVPGQVKTRLTPHFTPKEASLLAAAALHDTLAAVRAVPALRRVLVLDGELTDEMLPDEATVGFDIIPQCSGTLDVRLAGAFSQVRHPAVLVGMDTPQITSDLIDVSWANHDAWFGPAEDGGFWLIGFRLPQPQLILGVPMSASDTGRRQRHRLTGAGLRVGDAPMLRDMDTAADVRHIARQAPGTRMAELVSATMSGQPR
jgi:uncharacterized protein